MNEVNGYRSSGFNAPGISIHDYYINQFGSPWLRTYKGYRAGRDWHHIAFAGLQQCEHFQRLVYGAEAAGQADHGVALLNEHQLAGEEVLHMN